MKLFFCPQRKGFVKKPKHSTTQAEREHMRRVAELGCAIVNCCGPAGIHHIRSGMGMGQRASHYQTIPLCYRHHQGEEGIHTLGTKPWQRKYGDEKFLLFQTMRTLYGENLPAEAA